MELSNKLGQTATLSEIWTWANAYDSVVERWTNESWLDAKAQNVFYRRIENAKRHGAGERELSRIDAADVRLTLWDRAQVFMSNFSLGRFILTAIEWTQSEPDYSAVPH